MLAQTLFAAAPPEAEDPDTAAVAGAVEEDILLGRLLPRERLLGEAMAARFGVSRNAIRRAFALLAARGLVALSPNRGAQVRDFTETEIAELIETRAVLQRHAAGRIPLPAPAPLLDALGTEAAARRAIPDMDSHLAAGDLAPLMRWLNGQVHGQGARLGFQDLLRHATGKPLDPADFTAHLTARYLTA